MVKPTSEFFTTRSPRWPYLSALSEGEAAVRVTKVMSIKTETNMTVGKLSENQIRIRIVPTHLRWPKAGTSVVWTNAHDCVDALQNLVRSIDVACTEAEQDRKFSGDAIARRRAEICDQALRRLPNFRPFEIAARALTDSIDALERLSARDPEQVKLHSQFVQARRDLEEGIGATRRMALERCKMRDVVSVSNWR